MRSRALTGHAGSLIAGTAAANDLVLATRNTGDFAPLGIDLLDPWIEPTP